MTPTTSTLPCAPRLSVAGRRFHDSLEMLTGQQRCTQLAEVSGGADGVCFDNRCRRADGSSCSLSWSVWADAEHQVLYRSVRDVTELREHSDVVTKILAELERSNTKLAHVAYVALHDLVQPLTTQRRRDDVKLCR